MRKIEKIIKFISYYYKQASPFELVAETHKEGTPWSEVYKKHKKGKIENKSISTYFREHYLGQWFNKNV